MFGLTGCTESVTWNPSPIRTEKVESIPPRSTLRFGFETEGQPILIEVLGVDVNARSRVVDGSDAVLSEIEPAFLRSAPVYHVVEGDLAGSLRLDIKAIQSTKQAALTINWYHLPNASQRDRELTDAWRKLAHGLQVVQGEKHEDWSQNMLALQRAAESFDRFGLTEQVLWARYFHAYFDYYPLYRYSESQATVQAVIEEANRRDLRALEMLGHQLAGQVLVEREAGIDEAQARRDYEAAQEHFAKSLRIASETGNGFETIWSINNMGIASKYQDNPRKALDEYGEALDLAIDLADPYLVNLIGGNMAVAQESLGEIREAIRTLERIEHELSINDQPAELEHILSLLGGYYLKLYEFPAALEKITRALELSEQMGIAESRGRNHLLLGQIYRELGQVEKAQLNIELAIPQLVASRNGRGLKRAYALAADLHRRQENYADMQTARNRQEQYLANDADRALWTWSSALDALARGDAEGALPLFEISADQLASTSMHYIGELAMLHACVLKAASDDAGICSSQSIEPTTLRLRTHQASRFQLESRFMWARLLAMEGKTDSARETMDQLIEDIRYFRRALPGVLGAWYWDSRTSLFDFYLELTIATASNDEEQAFRSLEALSKLRNPGLETRPKAHGTDDNTLSTSRSNRLRDLIARRERADSPAELEQTQREIDLLLFEVRLPPAQSDSEKGLVELRGALKAIPDNWSLLTFHLAEDRALAWAGNSHGLRLHELGRGDQLQNLIHAALQEIRTVNSTRSEGLLAEIGERLIEPISAHLRTNILYFGAGALSDFPIEALIVDGDYLIQQHLVMNALSLTSLGRLTVLSRNVPLRPRTMFLAGDPDLELADKQALTGSARELRTVETSFPEAKCDTFTGRQLDRSAFQHPAFKTAELVHIASHASIDMSYPELSRIELTRGFLTPADLSLRRIVAQLVVLSACETAGLSRFEYDTQLGFVTELLNAGALNVLATLWPVSDREADKFIARLYENLANGGSVQEALRSAKLATIKTEFATVRQWGSFQLYAE
jgi:CHAT domain-containing protein